MEAERTVVKNNIVFLDDKSQYSYTIMPFEVINALGTVSAVLKEFSIHNCHGEIYKLYKTKEGYWYDINVIDSGKVNSILQALKTAIDKQQNI